MPWPALLLALAPAAPCAEATTTLAMTECLMVEVRRADAELERILLTAQQRIQGEQPIDLAATQRLWVAYRQAHCGDIASRWRGASLRPVVTAECLLRLSRTRSHELWSAYLRSPEGAAPEPKP